MIGATFCIETPTIKDDLSCVTLQSDSIFTHTAIPNKFAKLGATITLKPNRHFRVHAGPWVIVNVGQFDSSAHREWWSEVQSYEDPQK